MADLTAHINQRFQITFNVSNQAAAYSTAIDDAIWVMQVRPFEGSPVIALDFRTGGSDQDASLTATYDSGSQSVKFQGPTSVIAESVTAEAYVFDYGFILPDADFERVDGGTITFMAGVTQAGVAGKPAPPEGSTDTL